MSPLEKKKKEAELMRVRAARMELEIKIAEREEEIARIRDHILVQENKEIELLNDLNK
jgi:hypothetical protein